MQTAKLPEIISSCFSEELERRFEEAEELLEISQSDRRTLEDELKESISAALRRQAENADAPQVAARAARAAADVICASIDGLRRRPVEAAVRAAAEGVVRGRLEGPAKKYLTLLRAARALYEQALPWKVAEAVAARLDSTADWLRLEPVDYDRICGVILPERDEGSFRRYAVDTLAQWQRFCDAVLPEAYRDPERAPAPTDELAGTWEKVDVMAERAAAGRLLHSPADAELRESDGVVAPQAAGNGKKDARVIDGVAAGKLVVRLMGVEPAEPTPEEEWGDPDWWRLRGDLVPRRDGEDMVVVSAAVIDDDPGGDADCGAAVPSRPLLELPPPADAPPGKRKKKRQSADENWLPFDGYLGEG